MIEDGVTTETVLQNLKSSSEESKLSGIKMLLQLLETDSKQAVPFLQCDGLTPLVAMLRHCQGESRIQAVCVIAKLVADGEPHRALTIAHAGAVLPLVSMVGAGSDLGRSWAAATLALLMAQEQGDYCKKLMLKAGGFMPILTLSGLADKRKAMPVSEQVASNARAALAALALSPDAASQLRQLQGGDFLQSGRQDLLALCTRTGARQPRQVVITTPKPHRDSRPTTPLVPILSRPNSVRQQIPPTKPHVASRPSSGNLASGQVSDKNSASFAAPPDLRPFENTAAAGYGSLDEDSRLVDEEAELLLGQSPVPDDLEMAKLLREEMERLKEETLEAEQSAQDQARFEELEADQLLQEEMIYTLDSRAGRSRVSRAKMR